jgi:hypothetical protein
VTLPNDVADGYLCQVLERIAEHLVKRIHELPP